jgi:DHA2 family methylenomycin A resistance protein-like MFS transporter
LPAALCGGYFLVLLDVTVVNVALPRLGVDLSAGAHLAWVVDAYTVPLAALLLASGAVGDRIGHRLVVLVGYTGFGLASAACALAPSVGVLVAGRAVQGVSAALMLPGTLALLTETAPTEAGRARIVGQWAAVGGAALPAGPVLGGLLVQETGWRSVFWLSVPVIALALVPVLRLPPRPTRPVDAGGVDWIGAALVVTGLGSVVTAILQARADPPMAAALGALGGVAGIVLWRFERSVPHPLLDVPATSVRPLASACSVAGLMNLCVLGSLFLLTQVLQGIHGLDPLTAGMVLLSAMLPLPVLGRPAGGLTSRFGPWRVSAAGLLLAALGFAGVAASLRGPDYPALLSALALWGAGIGVLTPAIVVAALQALPAAPGTASGASNTARQTGGALGVALFGAVAGTATSPEFLAHTLQLLTAGALAFASASAICLVAASAFGKPEA